MVKFIGSVNRLDNKPNKRKSGIARLHRKIVDGTERSKGVLNMAANTKALPVMDVNISGTLRMQFMTTTCSCQVRTVLHISHVVGFCFVFFDKGVV